MVKDDIDKDQCQVWEVNQDRAPGRTHFGVLRNPYEPSKGTRLFENLPGASVHRILFAQITDTTRLEISGILGNLHKSMSIHSERTSSHIQVLLYTGAVIGNDRIWG
jgi:hypothetical protein